MLALFIVLIGFVLYTYAGYPLLCLLRARRTDTGPGTGPGPGSCRMACASPTVTVVIAAYRERRTIARKLASLAQQTYPAGLLDVIVVCDGSDDGTQEIARAAGAQHLPGRCQVIDLPRGGKPQALNAGVTAARGEVLVMTDARQELNPEAIAALCQALSDPQVGAVSGELILSGSAGSAAYWRYEAWIRKNESRAGSVIGVSGALYALPRRLWRPLPGETILDDLYVPMQLRLAEPGLRVVLEPAARAYDQSAEDAREFSRKARTLAGNFQLLWLLPALLSPRRNPSFFDFVSHKLCRLLVPYALLALLGVSGALVAGRAQPAWLWQGALLGQLLCYGLAALSRFGPARRISLVRLCGTFVVLNAAAVVGLFRILRYGLRQPWT